MPPNSIGATARRERRPLVVATRLADGSRRTFCRASDAPPEIAEAMRSGVSRVVGEADARLHACAGGPRHPHRRDARRAGARRPRAARRLQGLGRRSTLRVRDRGPLRGRRAPRRVAGGLARPARARPHTAVVALTHVAHIDDEALSLALRSDCFYIGALGSGARTRGGWSGSRPRVSTKPPWRASRARRPRHRCAGAGGDRGLDPRRDRQDAPRSLRWPASARCCSPPALRRFGAGKLLAELGGRPLVAHAADALLATGSTRSSSSPGATASR